MCKPRFSTRMTTRPRTQLFSNENNILTIRAPFMTYVHAVMLALYSSRHTATWRCTIAILWHGIIIVSGSRQNVMRLEECFCTKPLFHFISIINWIVDSSSHKRHVSKSSENNLNALYILHYFRDVFIALVDIIIKQFLKSTFIKKYIFDFFSIVCYKLYTWKISKTVCFVESKRNFTNF